MNRYTNSLKLLDEAKRLIPLATQTFSKGYQYGPSLYPKFLLSGEGAYVFDVDGNKYTDYILGLGPITLGYNYLAVNEAISKQIMSGIVFSLPHPLEIIMAELLHQVIPCAEMVRFLKTGSEACQAAVRIARAYTHRNAILYRGYHGWIDWYAIDSERPKGIPTNLKNYIESFEYNNLEHLYRIFHGHHPPIAAVIMEPTIVDPPLPGYLEEVKNMAHNNGALLIFDETVTGFRMSLGGAQEYFGVIPDLATFGKGIANGMPLSAVVGKADIMREFEEVFVSSTFGGECLSLAAGIATVNEMKSKNTIGHAWKMGMRLMNGLKDIGLDYKGYPCRPMIVLPKEDMESRSLFIQEMAIKGNLIHNSMVLNLCYSHSEEDIDKTLEDIAITCLDMKTGKAKLVGEVVKPAFKRL